MICFGGRESDSKLKIENKIEFGETRASAPLKRVGYSARYWGQKQRPRIILFSKSSYSTIHFVSSVYPFDLFPDGKTLGFLISLMNHFLSCDVFSSPLPKCFLYSYYHQYHYFYYSHYHYSFYYHYSYYHFLMNRPFCRTGSSQVYVHWTEWRGKQFWILSAVNEDEEDHWSQRK